MDQKRKVDGKGLVTSISCSVPAADPSHYRLTMPLYRCSHLGRVGRGRALLHHVTLAFLIIGDGYIKMWQKWSRNTAGKNDLGRRKNLALQVHGYISFSRNLHI